jgi:hypothetical protein
VARWTSVAGKLALAALSSAVAIAGAGALVMYQHVQTRSVPADEAAAALSSARAAAAGVNNRPMLEVSGQLQLLVRRDATRERRRFVVRADIPEWLLRIASADGRIRLANLDVIQKDNERITLEDLERHGPGPILDVNVPQGRQVIVWIE